jgi:predicted Zn-dependent protease
MAPDGKERVRADVIRDQAIALCMRGWYRDAFMQYRELLFNCGVQTSAVLSEAGFVCWKLGILDEAEACLVRALASNPDHREALLNLAEMRLSQGSMDGVDHCLTRLVAMFPDDPEVQAALARRLFVAGQNELGLRAVQSLVQQHASSTLAHILAATLLLAYGHVQEVLAMMESAIATGQHHPSYYDLRAQALAKRGDTVGSERVYRAMLARFPGHVVALCGLAKTIAERGNLMEAKAFAREAITKSPGYADASSTYFTIIAALKDWDELCTATLPYVEQEPPTQEAFVFHVAALTHLGQKDKLEVFLKKHEQLTKKFGPENIFY